MNEYLSKPVSPADLEAALSRAMGGPGCSSATAVSAASEPVRDEVLDWTELLAKARGNTSFLMKLFSAFVAEQPGNLESIREALALADFEQLAFLAHSLKGASATMCAPILREACHDLERAAKDHDLPRAQAGLAGMETAMTDVQRAMRSKLTAAGVA